LLYAKETTGQPWAQTMTDLLLNANKLRSAAREPHIVFGADDVRAFRTVNDEIVREGERLNPAHNGRVKQPTTVESVASIPPARRRDTALRRRLRRSVHQQHRRTRRAHAQSETEDLGLPSAHSTALSISASFAPASIPCANKATTCLPFYSRPSPALLFHQSRSG
jgi:hypothetical protein